MDCRGIEKPQRYYLLTQSESLSKAVKEKADRHIGAVFKPTMYVNKNTDSHENNTRNTRMGAIQIYLTAGIKETEISNGQS